MGSASIHRTSSHAHVSTHADFRCFARRSAANVIAGPLRARHAQRLRRVHSIVTHYSTHAVDTCVERLRQQSQVQLSTLELQHMQTSHRYNAALSKHRGPLQRSLGARPFAICSLLHGPSLCGKSPCRWNSIPTLRHPCIHHGGGGKV